MKTFGLILMVCQCLLIINGCSTKKKLNLKNEEVLVISDSLTLNLDQQTIASSTNFYYKDSIFLILNEGNNTISLLNFEGLKVAFYEFPNMSIDDAWLHNIDSIFIYSSALKKIYLLDASKKIIDSFNTKLSTQKIGVLGAQPEISTTQKPIIHKGGIYTTGYIIGEDSESRNKNKHVLSKIDHTDIQYFVNYPKDYENRNWGGIYYRMVYHCVVDDSLIYISFPGSNDVAKFNMNNDNSVFLKTYPDINSTIKGFGEKKFLAKDKRKIAKHYHGQYSYRGILYDKYRRLFYRFLLNPASKQNIQEDKLGVQKKWLLVYDKEFSYLGYKELNEQFSSSTYFVNEQGLFIKYFKNSKDEDHLFFYRLNIDSTKLQ